MSMTLHMHPASNASRPVLLFIAEKKLDVQNKVVDILKGEHYSPEFSAFNPNRLVPVLEDGDLRLTESAAILRYLAAKAGAPEYPTDLKKRAKVDEAMDWFNTQFYREYGYGLVYPQLFPHHKRPTEDFHNGLIDWAKEKVTTWFQILDQHWIGDKQYLCGDQITIADYFGACLTTIGEPIRSDLSGYKNISRWLGNMHKLAAWKQVNEALMGFRDMVKDMPFKSISPS